MNKQNSYLKKQHYNTCILTSFKVFIMKTWEIYLITQYSPVMPILGVLPSPENPDLPTRVFQGGQYFANPARLYFYFEKYLHLTSGGQISTNSRHLKSRFMRFILDLLFVYSLPEVLQIQGYRGIKQDFSIDVTRKRHIVASIPVAIFVLKVSSEVAEHV